MIEPISASFSHGKGRKNTLPQPKTSLDPILIFKIAGAMGGFG